MDYVFKLFNFLFSKYNLYVDFMFTRRKTVSALSVCIVSTAGNVPLVL